MNELFQFIPISQLADKFPEGSWWARFHQDFKDGELAAYHKGDLTLSSLNLDWEQPFPEETEVILIFVEGNFTAGHLYNRDTDGAIGLMVIGDLHARNITVGGQEIYVSGNLTSEEILCGSYNHGETIVKGDLSAAVLIQDDEYKFNVDGQKSIPCVLDAWEGEGVLRELPVNIQEVLIDDVLDTDEEGAEVSFYALVDVIAEGRSPLKDVNGLHALQQPASLYFTDNSISAENIRKLTRCVLMPSGKPSFDFQERDVYFKAQMAHKDDDGEQRDLSVYMSNDRHHFYIWVEDDLSVGMLWSPIDDGKHWEDVTEAFPEQVAEIGGCWTMLLTCVNLAELYLRTIEVKDVQDIMQHPAIQAIAYEDEETDGLWDGSKYYTFRKAYVDEDGEAWPHQIEIMAPDEAYYFYTLDNEAYVARYYQPPDIEEIQVMSLLDRRRWEASERYLTRFKQFIAQEIGAGV